MSNQYKAYPDIEIVWENNFTVVAKTSIGGLPIIEKHIGRPLPDEKTKIEVENILKTRISQKAELIQP